jgi:hypothetical protein
MTCFFMDPVFVSTTSCGASESHTYPTQSSKYKPCRSKAFGEVTNTTWAIEGTIRGTLSLFAKISILQDRIQKREDWGMQSQNCSTLQPPKARWKVTSPTGKTRLSFSRTNLFNSK